MNKYKCLVLMAAYNGDPYIKTQIWSILNQEDCDIHLIIADDCSNDNTRDILNMVQNESNQVTVIFNEQNKGFSRNFIELIYDNLNSNYDYFALADQDDFWKENKLSEAIKKMSSEDNTLPILYSSNLLLVDKDLKTIGVLSHPYKLLNKYNATIENICTGCTIVYNQSFCNLLKRTKPDVYLHDYWLFLIGYYAGNYIFDENYFIKYRQHANNQIGNHRKEKSIFQRLHDFLYEIYGRNIHKHTEMLNLFLENYSDCITYEDISIIKRVASQNFIDRLYVFTSSKYKKSRFKENLVFKLRVLLNKN